MTYLIEPGLHHKPHQEYHAGPGLSQSMIKALLRSPAHSKVPVEETPAMRFGRAFHTGVLEPHLFDEEYVTMPADCRVGSGTGQRSRKEAFEAMAAQKGQTIINPEDRDSISTMRAAIFANPEAAKLLQAGERELSGYWYDPIETDIFCRMRIDWLNRDARLLVDLKSTADARPHAFTRIAYDKGYHIEAAWFLYGTSQLTKVEHRDFYFVAVEVDPPHGVMVYKASEEFILEGLRACSRGVSIYKECITINEWPAYPPETQELNLPGWVRRKEPNMIID